jgi:ribose transport system substrate-binding protein
MNNSRRSLLLTGAIGAAATFFGVTPSFAADIKKPRVALIPGLTTDSYYTTMRAGAQLAAREFGLELIWQGAPDFNPVTQVPVLEAVIAQRPDVLLIAPTDTFQLIAPLRRAFDAGITVITVDEYIGDGIYQTGANDWSFPIANIASDNIEGGRIAGKALGEAVGGKGKVYVAHFRPGVSTMDEREAGFKAYVKEHFPAMEVLPAQYNDNDASKAASQFEGVFARNPDLAGVFGANVFSAIGAANGVRAAGQSGKVRVCAFDAPKTVIDDIQDGLVDLAIAQHPAEEGFLAVACAVATFNGQSIPPKIATGFTVLNAKNMDDPAFAKFIYK